MNKSNNDNKRNNIVLGLSLLTISGISLWGILWPEDLGAKANLALSFLINKFGWMYLISVTIFLGFCIYLLFSPYRNIRLGSDDSRPKYSRFSWFAMLFSAGMAIGLIFWGVAEPISHFVQPPHGLAEAGSAEAAKLALRFSFFHWGLHAWANYALFALAIGYFQLRKGYPGLISSLFIPLIGEKRVRGPIGIAIDLLAIFATVTGIATDLGLGTMQINSGLNMLYQIPDNLTSKLVIIAVATICFMTSAIKGLDKGIKRLSDFNMILCIILIGLVIAVGPKLLMASNLIEGAKGYFSNFITDGLPFKYLSSDSEWLGNWTIFYWAWWIAWTPFVGTFIARISWGRTIKEFILGVLFVPGILSILWFGVFGTFGMNKGIEAGAKAIESVPTAFFEIAKGYPLSGLISFVTILLLFVFFVTSADSSTFVLGMYSSNGDLNPSAKKKAIWGVAQSVLAIALLLAGGLQVLQTANIVAAFPFAFVMLLSIVSLMKSLKQEKIIKEVKKEKTSWREELNLKDEAPVINTMLEKIKE